MNRIGVMAESFNMGVSKGLEMAAQVGAAAVQVYVGGRGACENTWTPEYRRDILKKARDCGLVISAMCGADPTTDIKLAVAFLKKLLGQA